MMRAGPSMIETQAVATTVSLERQEAGPLPATVAYIHHGQVPGGAPTSLRILVEEVGRQAPRTKRQIWCVFPPMMPYFAQIDGAQVDKYIETPVLTGKKFIGWSPFFQTKTLGLLLRQLMATRTTIAREVAWLRRNRPDIVHLNSATLWTSAIAARRAGIPLVWHVRETLRGGPWNARKRLYGAFLRRTADAVIAISPQDAASLGSDREGKVNVIYNAVSLDHFMPERHDGRAARKSHGIPEDAFVILSLGGFSYRKGAWQLIRALKILPDRFHLVVAGDHLPRQPVRQTTLMTLRWRLEDLAVRIGWRATQTWRYPERVKAESASVESRLHQVGHLDDVAPLIAACDVLVFAGTIPHFARPIYEAWAMKKPVVAFDTPVMRSEIANGEDGLLVPRDAPEALAAAFTFIAQNATRAREFGERGRIKALGRFDSSANVRAVLNVYRKLMTNLSAKVATATSRDFPKRP
ncbi:MAG TPA: glycosyltransferase family 4 protein [Hyphomicrobiaceae bacterium]